MRGGNIVLVMLLLTLAVISYFFIEQIISFNSSPITLDIKTRESNLNITSYSSGKIQYYPNMKFNHNIITYSIDNSCDEKKAERMTEAIKILEEEIKLISFISSNEVADIKITCEEKTKPEEAGKYFIAGEGGPTSIINTSLFYVIEEGVILLYQNRFLCDFPNVEMHELLHVFGFEHSDTKESIMYPISSCNQFLTEDIKEELKRLYSIENLPELYFSEIEVSQQGNYINFELKIKNSGLIEAKNIVLEIYSESTGAELEVFDIGEISYGEGKYLKVENLKIPFRTKKLIFEIRGGEELDKENNLIEIELK